MSFKQTSEGRVFFKGADNDDAPAAQKSGKITDPVITTDQTQMQILLLLKSLNAKLKETKQGSVEIKKELAGYKQIIKDLEGKTNAQESNYIELEQQVARKNIETNKKTERVEQTVKETHKKALETEEQIKDAFKRLEEARSLVAAIEEKHKVEDSALTEIKTHIEDNKKNEEKLIARQKIIEKQQKEYGEKMVNNVAAYVALTKRVSETETRQESLNNKIEEATAEFIKLDRKIDKAMEDRARMLRKMERIETAVMETRDALNAKAMVLLTNQGAIGGVDIPKINDELLQTDPIALNRRLQEETLMPWWRRPLRLQAPTLVAIMVVVLLIGWVIGETKFTPASEIKILEQSKQESKPRISLKQNEFEKIQQDDVIVKEESDLPPPPDYRDSVAEVLKSAEAEKAILPEVTPENTEIDQEEKIVQKENDKNADYGIKIHKGVSEIQDESLVVPAVKTTEINTIDIRNEDEMLAVLEKEPEKLAERLNQIEPGSIPAGNISAKEEKKISAPVNSVNKAAENEKINPNNENKQKLKSRIPPDMNLPDVAKKIEEKAYDGVPEAQHDMGAIYVTGHGSVKKDMNRAIKWFEEAAANGVANAKYNLGVLYHQGVGVSSDLNKAMGLYVQAADQGHPEAQYNLGIAYIEGIGVSYSPQKAAKYFEKAANNGITEAAYNLGLIYENGLLGETRPDDALMWYKKSADKGSNEAKSALEQLAKSLGITLDDVNRIADRVKNSKQAGGNPQSLNSSSEYEADENVIAEIQGELIRRGLYSGVIDGKNGPMTSNAIRSFQSAANLEQTGEPSSDLLSFMKASSQYSVSR